MLNSFIKNGVKFMKIFTVGASICGISAMDPVLAASIPNPKEDTQLASQPGSNNIVLAGGCFWGVQAVFQHTKGVKKLYRDMLAEVLIRHIMKLWVAARLATLNLCRLHMIHHKSPSGASLKFTSLWHITQLN